VDQRELEPRRARPRDDRARRAGVLGGVLEVAAADRRAAVVELDPAGQHERGGDHGHPGERERGQPEAEARLAPLGAGA
jgi:hypothetical protein